VNITVNITLSPVDPSTFDLTQVAAQLASTYGVSPSSLFVTLQSFVVIVQLQLAGAATSLDAAQQAALNRAVSLSLVLSPADVSVAASPPAGRRLASAAVTLRVLTGSSVAQASASLAQAQSADFLSSIVAALIAAGASVTGAALAAPPSCSVQLVLHFINVPPNTFSPPPPHPVPALPATSPPSLVSSGSGGSQPQTTLALGLGLGLGLLLCALLLAASIQRRRTVGDRVPIDSSKLARSSQKIPEILENPRAAPPVALKINASSTPVDCSPVPSPTDVKDTLFRLEM
jgi:hypothetical protein